MHLPGLRDHTQSTQKTLALRTMDRDWPQGCRTLAEGPLSNQARKERTVNA